MGLSKSCHTSDHWSQQNPVLGTLLQIHTIPSAGALDWETLFSLSLFFRLFYLFSFGLLFPLQLWCFLGLVI